jgi:hypothetical protein
MFSQLSCVCVWCHSNLLPGLCAFVRCLGCGQTFVVVSFVPLILKKKKKKLCCPNHVKGWCGLGRVQSPGDFDGLDSLESWFLSHRLVPHVTDKLTNKKNQ